MDDTCHKLKFTYMHYLTQFKNLELKIYKIEKDVKKHTIT